MSNEVKIYKIPDAGQEVHVIGDYVTVSWNISKTKKELRGDDGLTYSAEVYVRQGEPYISFNSVRDYRDGSFYLDDDDTVSGGLDLDAAKQVSSELLRAVEYLEGLSV